MWRERRRPRIHRHSRQCLAFLAATFQSRLPLQFFFSSRRRHTRYIGDWISDVCSSDLPPGTSMGGARPKATIEDGNRLWLGKFPEKGDRCNLQRVEYATLELARRCGIAVCNARLESVRSEERRVGKECRSRWARDPEKK